MRPADEVRAQIERDTADIAEQVTDEDLERFYVWDLEDRAKRAAEMIERLAGEHGPDHPSVVRLVVLKRRLVAAIDKKHAELFPQTS